MQFEPLDIPGLILITPQTFGDDRGFFEETYNEELFRKNGLPTHWVQDNHSKSGKNVLRGMHWQVPPYAQDKLVRVVTGRVVDVVVDIRKDSVYYGDYIMVELSEDNHQMLFVPKGFAHGFLTLSDEVNFVYKVSAPYNKASERAFLWSDQMVDIKWEIKDPILSDKDRNHPLLMEVDYKDLF